MVLRFHARGRAEPPTRNRLPPTRAPRRRRLRVGLTRGRAFRGLRDRCRDPRGEPTDLVPQEMSECAPANDDWLVSVMMPLASARWNVPLASGYVRLSWHDGEVDLRFTGLEPVSAHAAPAAARCGVLLIVAGQERRLRDTTCRPPSRPR